MIFHFDIWSIEMHFAPAASHDDGHKWMNQLVFHHPRDWYYIHLKVENATHTHEWCAWVAPFCAKMSIVTLHLSNRLAKKQKNQRRAAKRERKRENWQQHLLLPHTKSNEFGRWILIWLVTATTTTAVVVVATASAAPEAQQNNLVQFIFMFAND